MDIGESAGASQQRSEMLAVDIFCLISLLIRIYNLMFTILTKSTLIEVAALSAT